ncbi:hypothetical protein IscW_ISCW002167, partial [Ixodes scapularis]
SLLIRKCAVSLRRHHRGDLGVGPHAVHHLICRRRPPLHHGGRTVSVAYTDVVQLFAIFFGL